MGKKSGGGEIEVTQYYLSQHFGICAGADALVRIFIKEKIAWEGDQTAEGSISINRDDLFGGLKKEGGVKGSAYYLPGGSAQVMPDGLAARMGKTSLTCPGYRGLASLFFTGSAPAPAEAEAVSIEVWKHDTYTGSYGRFTGPVPDLKVYGLGDQISSLKAVGDWIVYEHDTYRGVSQTVTGNLPDPFPSGHPLHDKISSLKPVGFEGSADSGQAGFYWSANMPYLPSVWVTVRRILTRPDGSEQWYLAKAAIGSDMNPAHIIHECLTDVNFGMGTPVAALDNASFEAAADTLFDEGFGLSLMWTRQSSIQDFIQEILDHVQGVIYVDPSTGLLTLSLIRADYVAADLDELNPDNADLTSFSRKLWGDIVNEIVVTWTNPENEQEETIVVQDDASIATQGGIISDSRNYYGVRTATLAQDLAYRDLRSAGQPLAACQAEVDRSQWNLRPASVIKLTWPEYGLSELVMRVQSVDYGKAGDPMIKLQLIEDVYGLDIGSYDTPPGSSWVDPSTDPTPMDEVEIVTLPLFFAASAPVFSESPAYPEVISGILATSADAEIFAFELWDEITNTAGLTNWQIVTTNNVAARGELVDALDAEAQSLGVTFENVTGKTLPTVGGFAIIGEDGESGNEIALFQTTGGAYTLLRGCLDTVPRAWPAGTKAWFVDGSSLIEDTIIRAGGELVDYKLRSRTSIGLLDLDDAPLESYTLTDRPWLPNRPANITAYGEAWSNPVDGWIDAVDRPDPWVTVEWAIRNRLDEDALVLGWTDASGTAEDGQTTTIEVRDLDGVLLVEHDGLTGTSFDVPDASFGSEALVELRVYSERSDADGDFVSLQYFSHWVQVAPITADTTHITADTTAWTADEG